MASADDSYRRLFQRHAHPPGAMVASYRHRRIAAIAGTGSFVGITLWQWTLCAARFARESELDPPR